ncbi:hypothetical protein [Moorena bouillonii]|uniref:Uncharacterized protein n=1 Tax=Moorena bouillonii PNG TaxID=568701 RepID=A0A1U7NAL0_9CYAN|nr:hypothetical protein [Moorena bouillonii]OLT62975.1 hypothetical protein BJP37_32010 [Moorena bouillonii PNG]
MTLNLTEFYKGTNPSKTLDLTQKEDQKLYIDFSAVRGGALIQQLKAPITLSEDQPTCQLFTGHIGCGKSRNQTPINRDKTVFYSTNPTLTFL